MTTKYSTKKALISSIVVLALCFTMLVGTTFAWFTDSATSTGNIIKTGNLDVEMYYADGTEAVPTTAEGWTNVTTGGPIFNYTNWEPGYAQVRHIKIENKGSLALKYKVLIVADGEVTDLADVIDVYYVDPAVQVETADDLVNTTKLGTLTEALTMLGATGSGNLLAGKSDVVTIALVMQESAGNEYMNMSIGSTFTIQVLATQYTYEEDSFGNGYDKGAPWMGEVDLDWYLEDPDATEFVIRSGEELAGLAAIVNGTATANVATYSARATTAIHDDFKGQTIKLGGNINLNDLNWTPIGKVGASTTDFTNAFKGNFDGQGYTVSNLNVANTGWTGLFGIAHGSTLSNVTIDGAVVMSNRMAGTLVGQLYGSVNNCHVKNATVIATPNAVGNSYDNGDKVGGLVGWLGDNGNNRTLTDCTATNVELGGYRDIGGIAGYVASSTTVSGNSVAKVEIIADQTTNYYGDKDVNAGYIYGRLAGTINESNNTTDEESFVKSTYSKNGLTLKGDGEGNVTLYLVPDTYTEATVNVPEGVTAIGNYACAYNTNVETVVL